MKSALRLIYAAAAMMMIIMWGTIGFMALEKFSLLEAIYMTVITITTIGFQEVRTLHDHGRIFTIFLALSGTGLMLLYVGLLTQFIVEGRFSRIFGRRKVERAVARLKNHIVLCGAGRIGSLIANEFKKKKIPFVTIEHNIDKFNRMLEEGFLCIHGDASDEKMLKLAGVEKAKGLLLSLASDAETVYAILSAKQLNPDLYIIARAIEVGAEKTLKMAGANRIVSPYQSVSNRMVNAILRPAVVDMMELTFLDKNIDLTMEGINVSRNSFLAGKSLMKLNFRADYGLTIVGINRADGKMILGPGPNDVIESGDVLIIAGRKSDVEKLAAKMGE